MKAPARGLCGLLAEFGGPEALLEAARRAAEAGYRRADAFSPFPIEGLAEALGMRRSALPALVLGGGAAGALGGYAMQAFSATIHYPINSGGRPYNSWPSFIVVTFELTILFAALAAVLGMLALNGLPMPYHPLFNVPRFERATQDGFFLFIPCSDPSFDRAATEAFLKSLGSDGVHEVLA